MSVDVVSFLIGGGIVGAIALAAWLDSRAMDRDSDVFGKQDRK